MIHNVLNIEINAGLMKKLGWGMFLCDRPIMRKQLTGNTTIISGCQPLPWISHQQDYYILIS